MSESTESSLPSTPSDPEVHAPAPPFGLRVAAGLSLAAGGIGLLGTLAAWSARAGQSGARLGPTLNIALALSICIGSVLVWRRRRFGAYVVIAAWVLPLLANVALTGKLRFSGLLLLLAVLTVLANWRELR